MWFQPEPDSGLKKISAGPVPEWQRDWLPLRGNLVSPIIGGLSGGRTLRESARSRGPVAWRPPLFMKTSVPLLTALSLAPTVFAAELPIPDQIRFNRDVRPVLADKCFACHGFDPKDRKGDLRLDVREAALEAKAIVPGKPAESTLVERILTEDKEDLMPPPKSHKKLSKRDKEVLQRWIAQGAPYERHWAFDPPRKEVVPMLKQVGWVRNPIDAFLLAALEQAGLQPAPEADRRTLARRLSLDLTGLPPKPEEVEAFVSDPAPDAYEKLMERWMATPQWGEHRGRYWLDAARYADTHGIHIDAYREMWPYRDWVVAAFNRNQPFDQFTIEQFAGDLLPNPTREQLIATGFHRCNMTTGEGGTIAEENLALYANDRVTTTAWVWLGLTANCAACHDHKFDPVTQKDFYAMAAFFRNTTQGAMDGNAKDTRPVIYLPSAQDEGRFAELPKLISAGREALAKRRAEAVKESEAWVALVTPETLAILPKALQDSAQPLEIKSRPVSVSVRFAVPKEVGRYVLAQGPDWQLFVYGKRFGLQLGSDPKTAYQLVTRGDVRTPGKEEHFAAVYDGKGGVTLFLDGKEREDERKPVTDAGSVGKPAALAAGVTDLRMYGRLLSKDDAAMLFSEPELKKHLAVPVAQRTPAQKKALADFYAASVDVASVDLAAASEALVAEEAAIRARSTVTHIQEERKDSQPMANILMRGAYDKLGEKVTPAGFSALHPMPKDAPANRLGLAQWLMAPEHPLTARVTVNRFWQELFGTGLVRTAEDFGMQGELPSNQALLDWLAVEFRESGWDMRHMFKLMLTSAAYRQSAVVTPEKLARDPQNRMVSRGPRFRMDAEMVRDYALAASGTLVLKLGGPGTKPYQPSNIWEVVGLHGSKYSQDKGESLYRRTLYNFWKRQAPSPNMEAFNAPSRENCTVRRERTNTPLQALVTLNDPQFVEAARRMAESVLKTHSEPAPALDALARRVLLRPLNPMETQIFAAAQSDFEKEFNQSPERAAALLKTGEAPVDAGLPAARLASFSLVASQLLNLDEALNK